MANTKLGSRFNVVVAGLLVTLIATTIGCANEFVYLSSYPTSPLRAGQTFQLRASVSGGPAGEDIKWSIQATGVPLSEAGSITQNGLYTAPAVVNAPITVTIQATRASGASTSSIPIQVLPLVPVISAATPNLLAPGPMTLEIGGANFLSQTVATLNGNPISIAITSDNTAVLTGTVPSNADQASLVLHNPWDPMTSPEFNLPIASPASDPEGATSDGFPTPPGLTGCTNPNTGIATNDWGTAASPVYVDVSDINLINPSTLIPQYGFNTIFWTSHETKPGQSIFVTGAFTAAPKTVKIASIPLGTTDWGGLVQNSSTIVAATQQLSTGLSFIVPSTFPKGVYGFEIDDPTAPPVLGLANVPSMSWIIGQPSATDSQEALMHQVYDCGAEPGGVLRIFGKNFTDNDKVVLTGSSNAQYELTPFKVDATSISVNVPVAMIPGTYNIWLGSSTWDATSSPESQIQIYPPLALSAVNASCTALVGDGVTDNTRVLQACLDNDAPALGSDQVVYITIPAGTFVLSGGITGHPHEVLIGASSTTTNFVGKPTGTLPSTWISAPQYFGMANLSLTAPANPYLVASSDLTNSPLANGHLFFSGVNIQSTYDATNGNEGLFVLWGPDIQVYDSFFRSGSTSAFVFWYGDGAIVSGNEFVVDNANVGFADSQNVVFENNLIHSDNDPGNSSAAGAGLAFGRGFSLFGASAVSQDIYIAYNKFFHLGSPGQQIITNDGDGGAYVGTLADSTSDEVTLEDDPSWSWMGTTNPEASSIAIIAGTGVGQYSLIKSYSGRTIDLLTPWKVVPDSTSIVAITQNELNVTIAHNTITDTEGCPLCLVDALEGVIEDNNTSENGTTASEVGTFCPYGGPAAYGPSINLEVLRNVTNNISVAGFAGCLLSGLLMRDNMTPAGGYINSVDGENLISSALIEENRSDVISSSFGVPAVVIQNNYPSMPAATTVSPSQ